MVLVAVTRPSCPCARRSRSLVYVRVHMALSSPHDSALYPSGLPMDFLTTAFVYGMTWALERRLWQYWVLCWRLGLHLLVSSLGIRCISPLEVVLDLGGSGHPC